MHKAEDFQLFWITQAAFIVKDNKCLILEFAAGPGHWDIPGGRIDKLEDAEKSFRRELKEELGITKFDIIDLASHDIWYHKSKYKDGLQGVCALLFIIDNCDVSNLKLSSEHLDLKWISEKEIDKYKYWWPDTSRMLKAAFARYKQLK